MEGQVAPGTLLLAGVVGFAVVVAVLLARRPAPGGKLEAQIDNLTGNLVPTISAAVGDLAQLRQGFTFLSQAQADLGRMVGDLRQRVDQTTAGLADKTVQAQASLQKEIAEAHKLVEAVRTELSERKERDREIGRAVAHLEAVLAGSPTKGAAGENILDEAFSGFPPDMVERNFRVRGKVVEYALVLAGTHKRLPIDSKWPATNEVEKLAAETDPAARQRVVGEIQSAIRRKVREVAQYIDPLMTTDQAIAAIPDSVSPYCGELTYEAYRQGVILMAYSMIVPYVLNLYNLHLKYSRSVDLDSLDNALSSIEKNVDSLDKVLENSIQRGATMIGNAYDEARRIADRIKSTLVTIRALPSVAERQALVAGETLAGHQQAVDEGTEAREEETLSGGPVPRDGDDGGE